MANAIIKIVGEIDKESWRSISTDIWLAENDTKVENIVLIINSDGGVMEHVSEIWKEIKKCKKEVITIGKTSVMSTAAAIFMMAKRRILLPKTEFMLHKATLDIQEFDLDVAKVKKLIKELKEATQEVWESVIENSQLTEEILNKKCKGRDWIITEEELTKYGIITEPYDEEIVRQLLD